MLNKTSPISYSTSSWSVASSRSFTSRRSCFHTSSAESQSNLTFSDAIDGFDVGGADGLILRIAHDGVSAEDVEFDVVITGNET